jgi:hypothetical protein
VGQQTTLPGIRPAPACPVCASPSRPAGHRHRQPLFECTSCSLEWSEDRQQPVDSGHPARCATGSFNEKGPPRLENMEGPVDLGRPALNPVDMTPIHHQVLFGDRNESTP